MKTTEKLRTEKTTRPASRWRNRYLAFCGFVSSDEGRVISPGEFWATNCWPSRDVAETCGEEWERQWSDWGKYLGAFPLEGS